MTSVIKLETEIKTFFRQGRGDSIRKEENEPWTPKNIISTISARYWGSWIIPEGEEDDGDYDWEVLDVPSHDKLREFVARLNKQYTDFKFNYDVSEKNWISINIMTK